MNVTTVILIFLCLVFLVVHNMGFVGLNCRFYNFKVRASQVAPTSLATLSKEGPYIDMTKKDPIGQTYYQRPVVSYDSDQKLLTMKMNRSEPTIHFNDNTVSTDVRYDGVITISDFEYGKYNSDSVVTVRVSLYNNTGRDLVGFHVHDGAVVPGDVKCTKDGKKADYGGFTRFGPICFFIHTTHYWAKNIKELTDSGPDIFPLPLEDATPDNSFPLTTGSWCF